MAHKPEVRAESRGLFCVSVLGSSPSPGSLLEGNQTSRCNLSPVLVLRGLQWVGARLSGDVCYEEVIAGQKMGRTKKWQVLRGTRLRLLIFSQGSVEESQCRDWKYCRNVILQLRNVVYSTVHSCVFLIFNISITYIQYLHHFFKQYVLHSKQLFSFNYNL